jgi:LPS-assembly protein
MTLRKRFLITAAVLCHLLLVVPLVTSQLPPGKPSATPHASAGEKSATGPLSPCAQAAAAQREKGEDVYTICAIQQEEQGSVYQLHGAVEIYYETYVLKADEATYNSDTKEATATGHFALDGGPNDDHIRASHGTYNLGLETGRFYDVIGTTGLRFRGNAVILTSTAPFAFTGKIVDKTTPEHYLVYDGTITTCELPHPKWQFDALKVSVDVGGNAKIYRSNFLLHGIPILYFPFATHPVDKESRQSGFLMPSVARSSTKGTVVGDAYYWAISRMMDATLGAEYFSLRGWSQRGEFRAMPTEHSYLDLNYFGVIDRGIASAQRRRRECPSELSWNDRWLPRRGQYRLPEFVSFSACLQRGIQPGGIFGSEIAGFSLEVRGRDQREWISRALPELSEHDSGAGDHDFACPQS